MLNKDMKKILVTGGAGYIGSHAVKALCDDGYVVTVIDNLSKGHKKAVDARARFIELDLFNLDLLKNVFAEGDFDAVMHFAGLIEVGESMKAPLKYMHGNVICGMNVLEAMKSCGTDKIIFSSTAAVYGALEEVPIKENAALNPTNIYGFSKLTFENLLRKYGEFWGIKSVSLRYFNASGAAMDGNIGQDYRPDTHIIPRALKSVLGLYDAFYVYGTDYPTEDGTCIRDYIHVVDLVDAHLLALNYLFKGGNGETSEIFNLGNGEGFSVRKVIDVAEKIVKQKLVIKEMPRREGDPAILIADATKAKNILGWNPKHSSLEEIIGSAWKWHSNNPNGYN
jgi:UDP-glucose 4-epimerase